jgi:hypothetical protein
VLLLPNETRSKRERSAPAASQTHPPPVVRVAVCQILVIDGDAKATSVASSISCKKLRPSTPRLPSFLSLQSWVGRIPMMRTRWPNLAHQTQLSHEYGCCPTLPLVTGGRYKPAEYLRQPAHPLFGRFRSVDGHFMGWQLQSPISHFAICGKRLITRSLSFVPRS